MRTASALILLRAACARGQSLYLAGGLEVTQVAGGFEFTEGPCWLSGGMLIFSDIPANTVYRWTAKDGVQIHYQPSGNSNGLALDSQGRLLLAQHGLRRVARVEEDGTETALATHYQGKRLNSPNDLAVKSDGGIYFTDPPYGVNSAG
jgi:gluconolactonase